MPSSLTASSQIALRAAVSTFCGGKWEIDSHTLACDLRSRFPVLGAVVEKADISRALRVTGFVRDHAAGASAWKHRDRDHPRWGRQP